MAARESSDGLARSFEDLWIWQQARELVQCVYLDFSVQSNAKNDFGFRDQVQRAAVSIMNNIAEGFERESKADFCRLLIIAKASAGEVRSMYFLAEDLNYVASAVAEERRKTCRRIAAGIVSLSKHLRK